MEIAPSNMDLIYRDILEKMKTARFGKAPAKAFIAWTTYAFRPLSVDEIQNPIEMDINDKIDDVQRTISRFCGRLVCLDQQGKVQLAHSTASEYFTRKGVESEFALAKKEKATVDLHTIFQAGRTINSLLNRRAQHSPPVGLARRQSRTQGPSPLERKVPWPLKSQDSRLSCG